MCPPATATQPESIFFNPWKMNHSHMVAHNCLSLQVQGIQCPLLVSTGTAFVWCTNLQIKHLYPQNKTND